jgi:hypothetical protein
MYVFGGATRKAGKDADEISNDFLEFNFGRKIITFSLFIF